MVRWIERFWFWLGWWLCQHGSHSWSKRKCTRCTLDMDDVGKRTMRKPWGLIEEEPAADPPAG